ncbi:rhodanese-like domain-containing protein [Parafilimonas sp.]|uniref:rhodanese-like domain-containing protein n=1 Tax=Parafilimonas sp. TaxID=1969739 RepID=UPI0039E55FE3
MKKSLFIKACLLLFPSIYAIHSNAQNPVNWTDKQLMQPSELAGIIKNNPKDVTIISVGPFNTIPGAINVGMVSEQENMDKFKAQLSALNKDAKIVVYCGCCPYEHCPNVRPAIDALKQMKFTGFYLLNLPDNLKIDWINKGYPVTQQ